MRQKFSYKAICAVLLCIALLCMPLLGCENTNQGLVSPGETIRQWQGIMYFTPIYPSGNYFAQYEAEADWALKDAHTGDGEPTSFDVISFSASFPSDQYRYTFYAEMCPCYPKDNRLDTTIGYFDHKIEGMLFDANFALDMESGYVIIFVPDADHVLVGSTDQSTDPKAIFDHFEWFVSEHCPAYLNNDSTT